MKWDYSSVYRPQYKGQVEVTYKAIVQGLLVNILPNISWAYRAIVAKEKATLVLEKLHKVV